MSIAAFHLYNIQGNANESIVTETDPQSPEDRRAEGVEWNFKRAQGNLLGLRTCTALLHFIQGT